MVLRQSFPLEAGSEVCEGICFNKILTDNQIALIYRKLINFYPTRVDVANGVANEVSNTVDLVSILNVVFICFGINKNNKQRKFT